MHAEGAAFAETFALSAELHARKAAGLVAHPQGLAVELEAHVVQHPQPRQQRR